jgi:hypothetical protein
MHPGDKVRLLHGKEEGIIKRLVNPKVAEVEIEDGFLIPVAVRELVLVSKQEDRFFQPQVEKPNVDKGKKEIKATGKVKAAKGVFLAFVPMNEREVQLHVINNTDYRWIFGLFELRGAEEQGAQHGILDARASLACDKYFLGNLHNWPEWKLEILYYHALGSADARPLPSFFSFKAKPKPFTKGLADAPVIDKQAYLFQLDMESAQLPPLEKIKEAMLDGIRPEIPVSKQVAKTKSGGSTTVDLHIEALVQDAFAMPKEEILETQLKHFDKALDQALYFGADDITFIHGVGNGVLRHEIHKRLSKLADKLTFMDAQKEKFGYGATRVIFK